MHVIRFNVQQLYTVLTECLYFILDGYHKGTVVICLRSINKTVFVTDTECVYCAVRNGPLNKTDYIAS
jgi:hypothetical protein